MNWVGKNQVYVLLSMEGKGLLYQGSIPSKERINRCHINKNQVYVLPRAEDRGCLSGNQYLVRGE